MKMLRYSCGDGVVSEDGEVLVWGWGGECWCCGGVLWGWVGVG